MHVNLLAIQEMLATPDVEFSLNGLRAELNRLTGGSWQIGRRLCTLGHLLAAEAVMDRGSVQHHHCQSLRWRQMAK
jgi:hypothetical protein